MKNLKYYTEVLEELKPEDWDFKTLTTQELYQKEDYHFGAFNDIRTIDKDTEVYKSFKYVFENIIPPTKIIKWGDILELRKNKTFIGFQGTSLEAMHYHKYLPHVYTDKERTGKQIGNMDCKTPDGEYADITEFTPLLTQEQKDQDHIGISLNSMYYHSAKAHWLVQSIQEEGLRHPIQGVTFKVDDRFGFRIHPGSIRSKVFEELEDPNFEIFATDIHDIFDSKPLTCDEVLEYWCKKLEERKDTIGNYNMSVTLCNGNIEYNHALMDLDFRKEVWEHSKKATLQSKGKPLNIYIGYDSSHGDLHEVSKDSILKTLSNQHLGHLIKETEWKPEIKFLDISKLPDYNREYANQSTEFTYSRFLIPHLENYEGYSIFMDNDFIWRKSILPLFYYLNLDDAVACIQYKQIEHDETKFNGEVNIDYPKKLWSSLMVFNNGHEDCKKLTPEVVNTWTGKQLHQFEWTDKISKIPEKYVFTEGYDDPDEKWDYHGIHYTRGGPWVKDMDYSNINNLDDWLTAKTNLQKNQ
jgi:hypothetical protein